MKNRSVLISGAGIAGPTLAFWLARYGFEPVLVEHAPKLRTGGYMIDFWGLGYEVAERMGIMPALQRAGYHIDEARFVNGKGERVGGFGADVFSTITDGRYLSLQRSDLAREIYAACGKVETLFDESVTALQDEAGGVSVDFQRAPKRKFDLVIGADGLHSTVRELTFGGETQFDKYLGYYCAAFTIANYPHRNEGAYTSYSVPGKQVARYALRGGRTAFLIIFAENAKLSVGHHDAAAQKDIVRTRFRGQGWECDEILSAMDRSGDFYFDSASQIRMPRWSKGRVTLLGDACFCPSLIAGQGSALAMVGAYILAGELKKANGDHQVAFANYERIFAPFIADKQKSAEKFASSFAPKTRFGLFVRNKLSRMLSIPFIAHWTIGRLIEDRLKLADYGG